MGRTALRSRRILGGGRRQARHRGSERVAAEPGGPACGRGRGSLLRSGATGGSWVGAPPGRISLPAGATPPLALAVGTATLPPPHPALPPTPPPPTPHPHCAPH